MEVYKYLIVETTCSGIHEAEKIGSLILDARLAACVQIIPEVQSTYWWEGKLETSKESILRAKTREDKYPQLDQLISESHSYETPEIIATKVRKISEKYRQWLDRELDI